ncbi:MAG TPA: phosphatidylinositol-specific phospholipase C [Thermoanaerobaculia bacterium]|jgi:1-phosphatidylinositol phosphodiesterase|nr:phosphatidylinositol-specific phospholipase C [Thermoanaerobaculia bacterium]
MPTDLTNWMGAVPGSKKLSELSIPGTHDSGAKDPQADLDLTKNRLRTQTRSIAEQLTDGIRFLDIRVGYTNGAFALYHEDVSLGLTFQSVLTTCSNFLTAQPTETIIMSVKKEDDAPSSGNPAGKSFQARFSDYATAAGIFYLQNAIPQLHQVRGKIVLFRRFELTANTAAAVGIDAYNGFPNNRTRTIAGPPELRIQDYYDQTGVGSRAKKWNKIRKLLVEASAAGNADVLFVNFGSGAGVIENDFPDRVAADINPQLTTYFNDHTSGRFGIVITDFETAALNTLIIRTN